MSTRKDKTGHRRIVRMFGGIMKNYGKYETGVLDLMRSAPMNMPMWEDSHTDSDDYWCGGYMTIIKADKENG